MLAPLLYMLALGGIGAAVMFSGYSQVLRSNAEMTAINTVRQQLNSAGQTLSASAVLDSATSTIVQPPNVQLFSAVTDTARLPGNYAAVNATGTPHSYGVVDVNTGVRQLDPWGKYYVYCRWENPVSNAAAPSIMVISGGPDGLLSTKCGDTAAQGDDRLNKLTVAEAINRANVWQVNSSSQVKFGIQADAVKVNDDGSMEAKSLTLATPLAITSGGTGAVDAVGARTNLSVPSNTGNGASGLWDIGISGNAATATALLTPRDVSIAGSSGLVASAIAFDGTADVALALGGTLAITNGGTGAVTAGGARTNLGSTAIGDALFTTANAAAARTTLGATATGTALFTAADAAAARITLGLGSMAIQNADNVAITGGTISGADLTGSTMPGSGVTGSVGSADTVAASGITGIVSLAQGGTGVAASSNANLRNLIGTDNASNLLSGTLSEARLPLVTPSPAGTYGWGTIDAYGRVLEAREIAANAITQGNSGVSVSDTGSDGTVTITTEGLARLTVGPTGNVGIGTASPADKLDVNGNVRVRGAAGSDRSLLMSTLGSNRWSVSTNAVAESGSDAGSNFVITRYSDAGTAIGNALAISRATGAISTSGDMTIGGAATATGGFYGSFNGTFTGTVVGGVAVAGTNGQVQFNNAGSLGADLAFHWDNSTKRLGIGTNGPTSALDVVSGLITVRGASSGFNFGGRDGGAGFQWYANLGNASLWDNTNSVSRIFVAPGGNVGIGATSPLTTLDVRGTITAGNASSTSGTILMQGYYSSGALATFATEYSSGAPIIGYGVTPSTSALANFLSSTPIALGRSAITANSNITFYTGATQTVATGSAATMSPVMTILNSGNVGIGTTAPAASSLLDLSSNTKGMLPPRMTTAQKTAISSPAAGLTVYDSTLNQLAVYNGTAWGAVGGGAGALSALTDVALTSTANNDILRYDSTSSKWKNVNIGTAMSTTTMASGWPDAIVCYGATGETVLYHSYWNTSGGTHTYITGFTNSTPAENLRVVFNSTGVWSSVGNAASWAGWYETNCNSAASTITTFYAAGRAFNFIGSSLASAAAPSGGVQFNNGAGALAGDTALIWDNTNKRLGIGTNAPSTALDVRGTSNGMIISGTSANYMTYGFDGANFIATPSGSGNMIFGYNSGAGRTIAFYSAGTTTPQLSILASGNVGIGTTAPGAKLQVSGGTLLLDNSQYITMKDSAGVADEILGVWSDDFTKILSAKNGIDFQNDAGSTLVRIQDGGNVGIGTTAPSTALDLNGAQTFRGMAAPAVSPAGQGRMYFDTTANKFKVSQNGGAYADLVGGGSGGAISSLSDVVLTSVADSDILRYDSTSSKWKNVSLGAALSGTSATTTMEANFPDAIVCTTGSIKQYMNANHSDGTNLYYEAPYSAVGGTRYWVGYSLSTGAYAATQSNMGGSDCVTGALSVSALYAAGKAFNFIGSSLASAAAPSGGVQFNNGAGALAGDTALVWDNASKALGIGTATPSSKAVLDLSSTTKGFLPPRMTTAQRDAIAAPSTGLIVYNTTNAALEMFNGASWTSVGSALPNGAIAAFASASCPSGWSEYTPARGRFLRGIDNGAGLDAGGTRAPGHQQTDATAINGLSATTNASLNILSPQPNTGGAHDLSRGPSAGSVTLASTDTETRPYNVAVTFCQYNGSGGGGGATALVALSDVAISGATNGQVLTYDSTAGKWINQAGGGTSQWTTAGANIHYNSGNVGLGISTPDNKLTLASGGIGLTYATATNSGGIGLGPDVSSGSYNFSYTNSQGTYLTRHYGMTILPNASPEVYLAGYGGLGLIAGGANRLHITTAGNVGIGTTIPLGKLDVRNGSILAGDVSSTNGSVILQGYYSGTDTTAVFGTQRSSGAPVLGYGVRPSTSLAGSFLSSFTFAGPRAALVVGDSATATGDIKFYTGATQTVAPGSAVTLSPVMTILNNGNVGIGTVAPSAKLHVTGNSKIETGVLDLDPGYSIRWGGAASGIYSGSGVTDMVFSVGSSERVRINGSSGNVGIGIASPGALLHLVKAGSGHNSEGTNALRITDTATAADTALQAGVDTTLHAGYIQAMQPATSWTSRPLLLQANGGNVGIGTTNPATILHLRKDQTAATRLLIDNVGTIGASTTTSVALGESGTAYAEFRRFRDGSGLAEIGNNGNAPFGIFANNVRAVTVLGNGNVGIGTTSPGSALHVNTNGTANETRLSIGTGYQDTTNDNGMHFYAYSDNNNYIDSKVGTNGKTYYRTGHGTEGGAARNWMTVDAATGNVGIGSTSPATKLDVAGTIRSSTGGIQFPDGTTQTTAATGGGGSGSNYQSFTASGTWTKPGSGNVAMIECWGGGGSGGRNYGSGGGGGGYNTRMIALAVLPATVTVTVGAGGAAKAVNGNGNVGGNTTFGSYLTAYGGGGGAGNAGQGGGGGGGQLSAGATASASCTNSPGKPAITTGTTSFTCGYATCYGPTFMGQGGGCAVDGSGGAYSTAQSGITHGGGGGAYYTSDIGASSVYGGGGGGAYPATAGGTSSFGGNGGAAASGNATNGAQPGGGGGASLSGTSGAGGAGQCNVTVW